MFFLVGAARAAPPPAPRDRGAGFDIEAVGEDRHGLRNSIIGRIERHGGKVDVRSTPGTGTEIEISMPR